MTDCNTPRVLVVIATYNEIDNLPKLVDAIERQVPEASILVVDDNSPDGTGQWCKVRGAIDARFHVMHRAGKLGLGTATIAGLRYAIDEQFDLVVTMDADFSHDPSYLPKLLATIGDPRAPCDIVIGSRYVAGGGIEGWPLYRRLMSRCVNWYARWMLRLTPHDCSGAFRCFRVDVLRKVDFGSVRSTGYSFLEELLWLLKRQQAVIREIPITFVDRTHGESKISYREAWHAVWIMFRLGIGV